MLIPYFSIIIPTYNRVKQVCISIESVLSQNFKNYEIIIIDDASTDNTIEELAKRYTDDRIKTLSLTKNGGQNVARNKGVSVSSGEWIIFLDSDDSLTENILEKLYVLAQDIKTSAIYAQCIDSEGQITSNYPSFEGYLSYKDYLCGKVKGEYLPIIKKDILIATPFDESTRRAPGIGHVAIAKKLGAVYISSLIARNYNTIGADRLCIQKKNHNSLAEVWSIIIKKQWKDRLKFCPCKLIEAILKFSYYTIRSLKK